MARRKPTPTQRERLLEPNASRCCVCKRGNIGFNLHHIDGNPSNTVDENLSVLCVEDHDRHHRPDEYESPSNHLELQPNEILRFKNSWEAFVLEANQPDPKVLATLSCYGTAEMILSLQLVMQWPDERIEYKRSFHLLDRDLDRLTDEVFEELAAIGPRVKMVLIDQPLPVEHCHACRIGLSRTVKPALVLRLTDPAGQPILPALFTSIQRSRRSPSCFSWERAKFSVVVYTSAKVSSCIMPAKVSMRLFQFSPSSAFVIKPSASSTG